MPAEATEAVAQDVAALAVGLADLLDVVLRAVQGVRGGDLHRLEDAVVEVALDARQRRHDLPVADHEADPPARHVVALGEREELDPDVLRARHLEERGRHVAVEAEVGVGEVVHHQALVLARKRDDATEEVELDHLGGGVVREVDDEGLRLGPGGAHRVLEARQEVGARQERDGAQVAARDDHRVLVDGIGGARAEHDVAGAEHGEREVPDALLRAHGDDRLRVGVEVDGEAALVPVADRDPQLVDAARHRVAVVGRLAHGLDQLLDHVRRARPVGVAHREVDDVLARPAGLELQVADDVEDVRREPLDAWEVHA